MREIGRGGSAICYAVSRQCDGHMFVLKKLLAPLSTIAATPGYGDEVLMMQQFSHPNIVQLYGSYVDDVDRLHMLLEFAEGGTMASHEFLPCPHSRSEVQLWSEACVCRFCRGVRSIARP